MKRIVGAALVVAGTFLLLRFAVYGTIGAPEGAEQSWKLPFQSLGNQYPDVALTLVGGAWGFLLGILLLVFNKKAVPVSKDASGPAARYAALAGGGRKGRASKILFLNSLALVSALFLVFIGTKTADPAAHATIIGAFYGAACLHIAAGLIIVLLALLEKPKSPIPLLVGLLLWLGGSAAGVFVYLQGA